MQRARRDRRRPSAPRLCSRASSASIRARPSARHVVRMRRHRAVGQPLVAASRIFLDESPCSWRASVVPTRPCRQPRDQKHQLQPGDHDHHARSPPAPPGPSARSRASERPISSIVSGSRRMPCSPIRSISADSRSARSASRGSSPASRPSAPTPSAAQSPSGRPGRDCARSSRRPPARPSTTCRNRDRACARRPRPPPWSSAAAAVRAASACRRSRSPRRAASAAAPSRSSLRLLAVDRLADGAERLGEIVDRVVVGHVAGLEMHLGDAAIVAAG